MEQIVYALQALLDLNVKHVLYLENGIIILILVIAQHQQLYGIKMIVYAQQEHLVLIVLLVQHQDNG